MAGSYRHITDDTGALLDNEQFPGMIENLGDAYEMAEELYGMIWWLAGQVASAPNLADAVEIARTRYRDGLDQSPRGDGTQR